jgi:hypothetical protein
VKDRKAWNDVVLKNKNPCKIVVKEEKEEEEEEEMKSLWLNYALPY